MKALVIAALMAAGTAHADLVASNGRNELRLVQEPCTNTEVLSYLKEEFHPQFKRATARVGGRQVSACWIEPEPGIYWVVFETGDAMAYPITMFTEEPGV